ncbi:LysR family transcriptional regulator [Roseomonas gilardii]|uniref:LysR family transcriptional regulator n=1 Tax=Roseomonas gilardii TaxID=257708 RepID=A0ABU3MJI5_9PROT|nr:LysR family transcriptional regulator [Roseomonas gilardii]MDT8332880.1 LysR family transcriptional regulator [Roseomonas gilardii]
METHRFRKCAVARLPDLEAWAVFAKVAETGSFTRAADELGLSKATVSKAVARLETRLGASLLNRTSRRLSLTESGREASASAGRILAEGEAIEARLTAQSHEPRGTVRLAAPMSFGIAHVAPLLPELLTRYRRMSVDLHLSDELVDLIGGGFDLALRIATLEDSSLRARKLCRVRRLLVGAPSYFDAQGAPRHPSEIEAHDCLGYAYLPTPERWRFHHASGEEVSVKPVGSLRVNNANAMLPMLLAGMGIGIQPEFLVSELLKAGRLQVAMPDWSMTPIALNIVSPFSAQRPARVGVVVDFLAERLSAAEWALGQGEEKVASG